MKRLLVLAFVPFLLGLDWDQEEARRMTPRPTPPPPVQIRATCWHASWCVACPKMIPIVEQLRNEGWPIGYADADKYPEVANEWQVTLLPTIHVHQGHNDLGRNVGVTTYDKVKELLQHAGAKADPAKVKSRPQPTRKDIPDDGY